WRGRSLLSGAGQDAREEEQDEVARELGELGQADAATSDRRVDAGPLQIAQVERDVADGRRRDEAAEGDRELGQVGPDEAETGGRRPGDHQRGTRDGQRGEADYAQGPA